MPTGKHRYSGIYYREASRKKSSVVVIVLYVKKAIESIRLCVCAYILLFHASLNYFIHDVIKR